MTTSLHVIVGAGPVGTSLAGLLVSQGHRVRVVTRSGRPTGIPGVEALAVDATDVGRLTDAAAGAEVIYNCANPGPYTAWEKAWPPLATAVLEAAERTGAVLVTASNLYCYGKVDGPMTADTVPAPTDHKGELRLRMWEQALAAHRAGRVRVTESRASDYIGPTLPVGSGVIAMYAAATLTGRTANVYADPDQPHTWTAVDDVAATLAALGRDERSWGSPSIVPSGPARSVREVLHDLNSALDLPEPRLRSVPRWVLRAGVPVVPMLRELVGVLYQFDAPFIADGSATTGLLGLRPTPWEEIIAETAPAWRDRARQR